MFTEADYKAIAKIISKEREVEEYLYQGGCYDSCQAIALALADYFAPDSSHFRRQEFLKNCGVEE